MIFPEILLPSLPPSHIYNSLFVFFFLIIGVIGKWHLGLHSSSNSDFHFHPLKQGFHYFYGLPLSNNNFCLFGGKHPKSLTSRGLTLAKILIAASVVAITSFIGYFADWLNKSTCALLLTTILLLSITILKYDMMIARFNCFVMKNYETVEQPVILESLTARFTDEAVNFIRANRDRPFLLYMSFAKVHTALFSTPAFVNHSVHGRYGDNVEEMDWSVGQIMATVEKLGLRENTFVYFTSDNGPHLEEVSNTGEYHGGWNGIFKGGKTVKSEDISQKLSTKREKNSSSIFQDIFLLLPLAHLPLPFSC